MQGSRFEATRRTGTRRGADAVKVEDVVNILAVSVLLAVTHTFGIPAWQETNSSTKRLKFLHQMHANRSPRESNLPLPLPLSVQAVGCASQATLDPSVLRCLIKASSKAQVARRCAPSWQRPHWLVSVVPPHRKVLDAVAHVHPIPWWLHRYPTTRIMPATSGHVRPLHEISGTNMFQ